MPGEPSAERSQPAEHEVDRAPQFRQLDQVAIEVLHKEEPLAVGRLLGRAHDFNAFPDQIVVPFLGIANIEAEVRQPHTIPRDLDRRLCWVELEDLDHYTTGHTDPAGFAGRLFAVDPEETSNPFGWLVGHAHERTAKNVPVEADRPVEIRDRDAAAAQGSCAHGRFSLSC